MVYVSGIGISQPAADEPTPSLEELVFEASRRALADAGLTREDVDGVCLAASDQLDGRAISSMHVAGPAGARLRDEIKVTDDGSLAFATAVTRIEAGVSRHVLAVSWTKPDASDTGRALSVNPEPIFTRPLGLHPWVGEAMCAHAFLAETGSDVGRIDGWADALGTGTQDDWLAYPLRWSHLPPPTQRAVAVVVTQEPSAVAVRGLAWGTDAASPTERGSLLGCLPAVASRALTEAEVPLDAGTLVETTDRSVVRLPMAMAGLGLCDLERAVVRMDSGNTGLFNPTGGLWSSNPVFAAGLDCVVRSVEHIRHGATSAVAHSAYGYAGQSHFVTLLGGAA